MDQPLGMIFLTPDTKKYWYIKIFFVSKDPLDTKNHTRYLWIFFVSSIKLIAPETGKRSSLVILLVSGVHKSDFLPGKTQWSMGVNRN